MRLTCSLQIMPRQKHVALKPSKQASTSQNRRVPNNLREEALVKFCVGGMKEYYELFKENRSFTLERALIFIGLAEVVLRVV